MRDSAAALLLPVLSLLFTVPRAACADVASCTRAHASGQREAKAGRLKLAAELFASCASWNDCPTPVRAECTEFYRDLERSIPTVIFIALDARGKETSNVRVYSSDQILSEQLDGRAVALDPGKYAFRFVFPQGTVVSSDVLVHEGEKNRVVSVQLEQQSAFAPEMPTATTGTATRRATQTSLDPPSDDRPPRRAALPMGFWISTGASAAALATWGTFGLLGRHQQTKLGECSPNCESSQHGRYDAMRRDYLIADLSLGISAICAGAATWLYLSNRHAPASNDERQAIGQITRVSWTPLVTGASVRVEVNWIAF